MADVPQSTTAESSAPPDRVAGLVAEFDSVDALRAAAARMRDEGFTRWDVHSPYPIHGIERAMGMRATPLAWLVFLAGVAGGLVALGVQWWMNAVDYPLVISGKPLFSLPANVPVAFELIVLFSALAAFGGAMALNRLPQFSHFVFRAERFRRVTTDGLFLSVAADDAKFDEWATAELLESCGATAVEICREPVAGDRLPRALRRGLIIAATLALVPPLLIGLARQTKSDKPRIHPIQDMDFQPKYKTQSASPLFADRRTMRPAVAGTVAVGDLQTDEHFYLGYRAGQAEEPPETEAGEKGKEEKDNKDDRNYFTTFPPQLDQRMGLLMDRGQERFNVYCAPCHGLVGDGSGMVSIRALERQDADWATPTSVHAKSVRQQPVGRLFHTITHGYGKMPGYAAQIPVEDRWAIVLYVRALERSQNASLDDVPEDVRPQLR